MIQFFLANRKRILLAPPDPKRTTVRIGLALVGIFAAHIVAMQVFEGMSFFDAWWLTATSLNTVGYGDLSASSVMGRIATFVIIYCLGIWVLMEAGGKFLGYLQDKNQKKLNGSWRWKLKDHVLIIGSPQAHPKHFFGRLTAELHDALGNPDIMLLTESFDEALPEYVTRNNVVHYTGTGHLHEELEAVDINSARAVVVLSDDPNDIGSDSKVLDIASRVRESGFLGRMVIELANDENRERAKSALSMFNGDKVNIIRPARSYPEMLVRAIVSPGSECILENYFREEGDEIKKIELGEAIWQMWSDVVIAVMREGCGIAVGYEDEDGNLVSNPDPDATVPATGLYVIVSDRCPNHQERISKLFAAKPLQAA